MRAQAEIVIEKWIYTVMFLTLNFGRPMEEKPPELKDEI